MPRPRFLLAVALVIKGASSLQAQCLAPGQPIEMIQPTPIIAAVSTQPVQVEEVLPPPVRVVESQPAHGKATLAPTLRRSRTGGELRQGGRRR